MKKPVIDKKQKIIFTTAFWVLGLLPFFTVSLLYLFQEEEDLPPVSLLDNPPELLASSVIAKNEMGLDTVIGHYWKINRSSIKYHQISPHVIDALISTEDERYYNHSGIDPIALARSAISFGSSGGASTITQQLAKQLFKLVDRENANSLMDKINIKAQEHIIATRLEKRFSKKEIITMYLNQFDFLYNAVGIESAANVYYNKKAEELSKTEAAMLVGMCKNPGLYNPYSFKNKNYRNKIALKRKIPPTKVSTSEIKSARKKDSTRAINRRNQVLFQWLRNSENNNEKLTNKITRKEYEKLCKEPLVVDYTSVDHKKGLAPYFRESLKDEIVSILLTKNLDGSYRYTKKDGTTYNIYKDGLKIYTTLNTSMQQKAEEAVFQHLSGVDPSGKNKKTKSWQKQFNKTVKYKKDKFPFLKKTSDQTIYNTIAIGRRDSKRYKTLKDNGVSDSDILKIFNTPTSMKVFSYGGEIDTVLTPNDSIRHNLSFLQSGLISIEPKTGFVRAWVGGADINYFKIDMVTNNKRQIGSTIKPFIYATALELGVVKPCTRFTKDECQVVEVDDFGQVIDKKNNPYVPNKRNKESNVWMATGGLLSNGLIQSNNPDRREPFAPQYLDAVRTD